MKWRGLGGGGGVGVVVKNYIQGFNLKIIVVWFVSSKKKGNRREKKHL